MPCDCRCMQCHQPTDCASIGPRHYGVCARAVCRNRMDAAALNGLENARRRGLVSNAEARRLGARLLPRN